MQKYSLGTILKDRRIKLGLTQEQVCEGICEPATLSRLESGKQKPSRQHVMALFQRLGLPTEQIFEPVTDKDVRCTNLEQELMKLHVLFERTDDTGKPDVWKQAQLVRHQLAALAKPDDRQICQLLLRSKYLLGKEDGPYDFNEGVKILLEAIAITVPKFDLDNINTGLYTYNELKIINNIALCYYREGMHEQALNIEGQLLSYLKAHLEYYPTNKELVSMIAFNYALELVLVKRYDEALEAAEYVRKFCIDHFFYKNLPGSLELLAFCYYHKGNVEKSIELYKEAYFLYKAIGNDNNRLLVEADAKALLNLTFE